MKCIECGHELKDGAVFCIRCGAMQVSANSQKNEATTQAVRPATAGNQTAGGRHNGTGGKSFKPTPRRSTASIVVPIVAVIAVLGAAAALAMFVLNPGSSGTSSSSTASAVESASSSSSSSSSSSASSSSSSSSSKSSSTSSSSASSSSASTASATTSSTGSANTANGATATQQNGNATTTTQNQNTQSTTQGQTTQNTQNTYQQQTTTGTDGSYYRSDTSTRYYTYGEVSQMSNYDLYYARNEIYARHGRMFDNADLQAYFNSKSWYTPTYTPAQWNALPQQLSDVEQKNVMLMHDVEAERNSPYL